MDLSVIIPTYNNAEMLARTLAAFERLDFPEASELIVVDNNSRDTTAKIVKGFSGRLPVRYVFEPQQGIAAAKNTGISAARGGLLVFTDDDVRPCTEWLTIHLSAYRQNPRGVFWGGPVVSEFEGRAPEERLLRVAPPSVRGLDYGARARLLEENEWFIGANMAFTSKAVAEVGGFDTTLGLNPKRRIVLGGEETDIQRRSRAAGYRAMYLPAASLRHVVPAKKCTVEHVAGRAEALGRYLRGIAPVERGEKTLRGVPLWRYRRCIETWVRAWAKRIAGRDWYPDYMSYRIDKGFLLGLPAPRGDGRE